jgi:hypothetical protein
MAVSVVRPRIEAEGLPQRGEVVLRRDRGLFPAMVAGLSPANLLLSGPEPDGEGSDTAIDADVLESAFSNADTVAAAAFVTGRVVGDDDDLTERLLGHLRRVVDGADPRNIDSRGTGYAEAAMSLALRGDLEVGRRALLPMVGEDANVGMGQWLAAYYLAQMGDPSGYPTLMDLLHSEDGFTRLMGVRHLVAFLPYDGQHVDSETVDVRARLVEHLDDPDKYVSMEVPGLLAEAGVEGLSTLLAATAKKGRHKETRQAAKHVLDDLEG